MKIQALCYNGIFRINFVTEYCSKESKNTIDKNLQGHKIIKLQHWKYENMKIHILPFSSHFILPSPGE